MLVGIYDIFYEIRDIFSDNYAIKENSNRILVCKHPQKKLDPEIRFHHVEHLKEITEKYKIDLILTANKTTFSIEPDLNAKLNLITQFELDVEKYEEYAKKLIESILPHHRFEAELIAQLVKRDNRKEFAEYNFNVRKNIVERQAYACSLIVQKLQYLGLKFKHDYDPIVEEFRGAYHYFTIESRTITLSNLTFLIEVLHSKEFLENYGFIRTVFKPRDFLWVLEVY